MRAAGSAKTPNRLFAYGKSRNFGSHVALMTHDIPVLENIAKLDEVSALAAPLIALRIRIKGGSGVCVLTEGD